MNYTDNLNFKGKFRKYDPNGNLMKYSIGDTIEFNGTLYTATKTIIDTPPSKINSGWEVLSATNNFYASDTPPSELTYKGDRWFRPSNGVLYTRVKDDNGMHWVEL